MKLGTIGEEWDGIIKENYCIQRAGMNRIRIVDVICYFGGRFLYLDIVYTVIYTYISPISQSVTFHRERHLG